MTVHCNFVKKSYFKSEESVLMATKQYFGFQEVVINYFLKSKQT